METQVISRRPHLDCQQQLDPLGLTPLPAENRERFLRFTLAKKNNMLAPLAQIIEVMQLPEAAVLPVPNMPESVLGICSWQGKTLWLIDLNMLVGYGPLHRQCSVESQRLTPPVVIVVQHEAHSLGLVVEKVGDVDLIDPAIVQGQTGLCPLVLEPFILGHCPPAQDQDGGIVLDVSAVVSAFCNASSEF